MVGCVMKTTWCNMRWCSNKPVPDEVAELTHCTCKKGCQTNQCRCRKSNLQCMEACLCNDTCKNTRHEEDFDEDDENEVTYRAWQIFFRAWTFTYAVEIKVVRWRTLKLNSVYVVRLSLSSNNYLQRYVLL